MRYRFRSLAAALVLASLTPLASAQLTPDRTYYCVGRPVPMQVAVPADTKGEAKIAMFAAGATEPTESAPVVAGGANLATLFPKMWEDKAPRVMYAQLIVGEKKIGAPVVLQPMLDGSPAVMDRNTGRPAFPSGGKSFNGVRAYVEKTWSSKPAMAQ